MTHPITPKEQAIKDMKQDNVKVSCLKRAREINTFTKQLKDQEI